MNSHRVLRTERINLNEYSAMTQTPGNQLSPFELLLKPFIEKNKEIYADAPMVLGGFEDLTLEDLEITNIVHTDAEHRSATIKSVSRNFIGPGQTWHTVSIHRADMFDLVEETVFTAEEVKEKTIEGVYRFATGEEADEDGLGAEKYLVILEPGTDADSAAQLAEIIVLEKLRYELLPDQVDAIGGEIIISGDTISGQLEYIVAAEGMFVLPQGSIM